MWHWLANNSPIVASFISALVYATSHLINRNSNKDRGEKYDRSQGPIIDTEDWHDGTWTDDSGRPW